jgi:hypothetical protein
VPNGWPVRTAKSNRFGNPICRSLEKLNRTQNTRRHSASRYLRRGNGPTLCDERCEVEPDGFCPHGYPSILRAAGMKKGSSEDSEDLSKKNRDARHQVAYVACNEITCVVTTRESTFAVSSAVSRPMSVGASANIARSGAPWAFERRKVAFLAPFKPPIWGRLSLRLMLGARLFRSLAHPWQSTEITRMSSS